ncbi:MAG: cytochrome c biogenesis protein CcsA [Anaerolineae bacterium]|nr:cytochrome c biogenesis protein CcsA [Anaerolineae bacterium]
MLISAAYMLLWGSLLFYFWLARANNFWDGWAATGTAVMSWGLLTIGLVQRGLSAGHWPLTTPYEFALCLIWVILAIYLLLEASWRERRAGGFVLGIALLVMTYAVLRPADKQALASLLPVLRSPWLQLHVLTTLLGFGAFGVAAGLGLMQLIKWQALTEESTQPLTRGEIERTMSRTVALGFPWLTLGILTGAIWAQTAWGRYWGWDPKETWALITWLWYLLILHVYPQRYWRGRRLAALVVAGFGLVLFTFIGVPWLVRTIRLESLHGF